VEGFKKAGFFEKILPDKVEIFSKTRRAWTCFFEYPELIFALFFYFLFWINTPFVDSLNSCCKKDWGLIGRWSSLERVWNFEGWMKKPNQIIEMLFIRHWNFALFLIGFDFWGCLLVSLQSQCLVSRKISCENGKHLQKTMKTHAECDGAVAQVCVSFFICSLGFFWLLLWIADATKRVDRLSRSLQ
jgi:hypothetical protein